MECSVFPLQVSQKSTSRVINGRTVRNGPEASGKRLFFQGTRPDDPWQNCKIREKLINEGKELTLDKAVDIAWTYEMSQSEMKSMEAGDEAVHSVNTGSKRYVWKMRKDPRKGLMSSQGENVPTVQKASHFANMCKTRDQKVHEVSDNPYQVSDSL